MGIRICARHMTEPHDCLNLRQSTERDVVPLVNRPPGGHPIAPYRRPMDPGLLVSTRGIARRHVAAYRQDRRGQEGVWHRPRAVPLHATGVVPRGQHFVFETLRRADRPETLT